MGGATPEAVAMITDQAPLPRVIPLDGPARRVVLSGRPAVLGQLARAVRLGGRPRGRLDEDARLGSFEVTQAGVAIDPAALARFRAVCGCQDAAAVPSAFCETLFQGLLVELVLAPGFPLAAMGLIHLRQRLTAHRALDPGERLDLACRLAEARATARGVELDCAMEARADGATAWEGLATLLSRDGTARTPGAPRTVEARADAGWSEPRFAEVPAGTGWRYARASGDYNPFHLHALLARPFGFPRAVAHGMWTLAWALARLGAAPPAAHSVEASFRKPVLMPARIAVRERPAGGEVEVEVRSAGLDLLHLSARVR